MSMDMYLSEVSPNEILRLSAAREAAEAVLAESVRRSGEQRLWSRQIIKRRKF